MCGISGIWHYRNQPIDLEALEQATTALRHRGPDDEGYLLANTRSKRLLLCGGRDTSPALNQPRIETCSGETFDLAFGFRRLSILDLSPAGHQPMGSMDESCWIVFNGEIYNYLELRAELADYGYEFRTGTDSEVILAAYQHWGLECLNHFNGMWAFALLDLNSRRLFLSRDRFGVKPLYYLEQEGRFLFASEIKALINFSEAGLRVNARRLYDYLRYGLSDYGDETFFDGIRQFPAAHFMLIPLDGPASSAQAVRYWEIDLNRKAELSFAEAAVQLRELFIESVRLHLRSDVPVGTALSGGIDSSAIVMCMRKLDSRLDLHTFSYVADDDVLSEERWIDNVTASAHSVAHKVKPSPEELINDLDRLISTQDEPFGSTSIYAQYRVFRLAHETGIKVMLDGQGADELLAGYRTYLVARTSSLLRQGQFVKAGRFLKQAGTLGPEISGRQLLVSASGMLLPASLQPLARRAIGSGSTPAWLNEEWFAGQGVGPRPLPKGRSRDVLQEQLYETLVESSLPMLLRYEDRNSMAHSIESRVPFLTAEIAEFVLSLPEDYLLGPDGTSKSVFRQAMRGIVPDGVLDRRDKIGFATPEKSWLNAARPWVEKVLSSRAAKQVSALNLERMKAEWEEIVAGRHKFDFTVWRWLNVICWSQRFEVGL